MPTLTEERDYFADYPLCLKASTTRPDHLYVRDKGHFAVHGTLEFRFDLPVIWESPEDRVCVYEGRADAGDATPDRQWLRPVYRLPPKGPLLVPTGSVFARFELGTVAEEKREEITKCGFCIASLVPHAPHCVWLQSEDELASTALSRISDIEAIGGVMNIEPQLLGPRFPR